MSGWAVTMDVGSQLLWRGAAAGLNRAREVRLGTAPDVCPLPLFRQAPATFTNAGNVTFAALSTSLVDVLFLVGGLCLPYNFLTTKHGLE